MKPGEVATMVVLIGLMMTSLVAVGLIALTDVSYAPT